MTMHIITTQGERHLYEALPHIKEKPERWRSIYLNFQALDESYRDGVRTQVMINTIKELLRDQEGRVYLCADGDIFMLFKGVPAKILEMVSAHMHDLFDLSQKVTADKESIAFCTIYDLSIDWMPFYEVCRNKYLVLQSNKNKETDKVEPAITKEAPIPRTIDKGLINRIKQQRDKREKAHVLLVEDDVFSRRLVKNILSDYQVLEAGSGQEALRLYATHAPEIVFLDIDLPDFSGHVVLQQIYDADPEAHVIMLSGNSYKEYILAAMEEGAKGFITKPFPRDKVLHYMQQYRKA